jgi:hypothetical protein
LATQYFHEPKILAQKKEIVKTKQKYDGSFGGSSIPARDETSESFPGGSVGS